MKLKELKLRRKVRHKQHPEMGVLTVCKHFDRLYLKNADGKRVIQLGWFSQPDDEIDFLEWANVR